MAKTWLKRFLILLVAAVLLSGATILSYQMGLQEGKSQVINSFFLKDATADGQNLDFTVFWNAWSSLKEKFINQDKLDPQKMLYGAVSGMVQSLGDPYTVFFNPEDSKKFLEDVAGKFEGIGMEIGQKKGQLQVIAPLEGMPAQKAGIRAGDKIIKIDGVLTTDMTLDQAVSRIRGKKGTEVTLTVFRDAWNDSRDFKLVRAVIEAPSLKWELKNQDVAYIHLFQFSEKAGTDFRQAVDEIIKSPAKKIILDLRNNPGGYLEISRQIASFFLEEGSLVASEDFGGKQESKMYLAQGSSVFSQTPLVVLINQGSASAAEILAGALRDDRQIKLIGETSFGKGSVQELDNLDNGSTLKVTVAKWLTPKGESISEHGLTPDIAVEITDEDYQKEKDPQLDKALEIISQMQ